MAIVPAIAFNSSAAQLNDYFNHDIVDTPLVLAENGKTTIKPGITIYQSLFIAHNHDDEITEVKFYLTPSTPETSAIAIGSQIQNFNITNENDKLFLQLDDRGFFYNITLTQGTRTAQQICDDINTTIEELIATVYLGSQVKITSPKKGTVSKIYMDSINSTCLSVLGFVPGENDIVASGTTSSWGNLGNGIYGKCVGSAVTYNVTITENNNDVLRLSLDFASFINITIPAGIYTNDAELTTAINTALTNASFDGSDILASVSSGIVTISSLTGLINSSVRVRPGLTNDASIILGLDSPLETLSDYANVSAQEDINEIISWGDSTAGLEIGDGVPVNWNTFSTNWGDTQETAIELIWGNGSTTDAISKFVINDNTTELATLLKFTIPVEVTKTGYREFSMAMEFTYL